MVPAIDLAHTRMIAIDDGHSMPAFNQSGLLHTPSMAESPSAYAVETVDLVKTYAARDGQPSVHALNGVSLSITKGAFFGLLGPNGAGKSTLINILAGLVVRSSGAARIWGYDIDREMRAARRAIGVVPQELNLDPFFTPRELLELQAGLYGVPKSRRRTNEILEAVGLSRQADAYARSLSGGMRRRLLVAKAMVHSPPVLVLDEPTAGVDVELRRHLWAYLRGLNSSGTTVLLTTHYLEEAQALCDRIAIIDHGGMIACDTTEALLRRIDSKTLTVTLDERITEVPSALLSRFNVTLRAPGRLVIQYAPSHVRGGEILAALNDCGLTLAEIATRETDLEDIFLKLTSQADEQDAHATEIRP
jgi:ABC-2 type transport system ATP-binding protein